MMEDFLIMNYIAVQKIAPLLSFCWAGMPNLVSTQANIISIIVGIFAQASMMIYGFGYLVPKMKKEKNSNN